MTKAKSQTVPRTDGLADIPGKRDKTKLLWASEDKGFHEPRRIKTVDKGSAVCYKHIISTGNSAAEADMRMASFNCMMCCDMRCEMRVLSVMPV